MIAELDRELETLSTQMAPALLELPGCGGPTAAKLLAEIGPIERFRADAQLARHGGVADSTLAATGNSTARSTESRSHSAACTRRHAPTSNAGI